MTKRILSVCLALVLLLGVLAGCSKKEAQTADDTKKTEQSDTEDKTSTQFAYQAQYFDLPEEIQWIGTSCVTGLGRHALLYRQHPGRRHRNLYRRKRRGIFL